MISLTFLQFVLLLLMVLVAAGGLMLVGAFVMFKGRSRAGEPFFRAAKGEVFTIEDKSLEDFPEGEKSDEEKTVLERSAKFLDGILNGGGKNEGT